MEEKILKLVSPIPVSVNHYLSYRVIKRGNKSMAMSYETSETKKYKKDFIAYVKKEVKKQGWEMSDNKFQHYYMDTVFYFPRIDMDANNYYKVPADAITDSECVWLDDTQLCERVQGIYYDSKNPRMEMTIYPVEYIGIFKDSTQLDEFKTNCIQCAKYKDGKCSVFKKAIEGRFQDDIVDTICNKFKTK